MTEDMKGSVTGLDWVRALKYKLHRQYSNGIACGHPDLHHTYSNYFDKGLQVFLIITYKDTMLQTMVQYTNT